MKRILALVLILSMMISLASCGCQDRNIGKLYTITFESNGGSTVPSQTVEARKTVQRPVTPTKEGFIFGGRTFYFYGGRKDEEDCLDLIISSACGKFGSL